MQTNINIYIYISCNHLIMLFKNCFWQMMAVGKNSKNIDILGNGPIKGKFVSEAWFYKTTCQCKCLYWCCFLIGPKHHKKHDNLNCYLKHPWQKYLAKIDRMAMCERALRCATCLCCFSKTEFLVWFEVLGQFFPLQSLKKVKPFF